MSSVTCHMSISLGGFVAGPNQSVENPLGEGGIVKVVASPAVAHVKYRVVR